ncbi:MAG: threonine synthase [Chloroflexi bacterium]|nr:threonine synthase [Chloroflexota bacterium]
MPKMSILLDRYRPFLPLTPRTPPLSLGEGDTPLVSAPALTSETGAQVWLKLEGCNPTGSFKDRGMVVAVAKAVEEGARAVICASTGNTAASAAAYAARVGLTCAVVIPNGKIALGKLSQALMHGANVLPVEGNFDRALQLVRELAEQGSITLVNSVNPYRIEGQKTAAFEIVEALGEAPEILALPVGNAGNITAYWRGFSEFYRLGRARQRPQMFGFQAAGAAPIVKGEPIPEPHTIATAIRIGNPASWKGAVAARDESGGLIEAVSDEEILEAYRFLARREGVFCEPASAAPVAGILKLAREKRLPQKKIVCILTGNGLKDPDTAIAQAELPAALPATMEALTRALSL